MVRQALALEETVCPLCRSADYRVAYRFDPYAVARCGVCGFYYLSPRLAEAAMLDIYRDDDYFEGTENGYTSYVEQEKALRATFRRFLDNLRRRGLSGGSLLEVGCGYGYLLDEARRDFSPRVGTDFSAQAVAEARRVADRVYQGGLEQLPPDETYDCIVAINVIEHIYDPLPFVESLVAHLAPGGRVVIATPHMGSFWRRLMGRRWASFKLPEHVLYFDSPALARLMQAAGLARVQPLPYPHAFPLALVAAKLNLTLMGPFGRANCWLPQTMVAMYGFKRDG